MLSLHYAQDTNKANKRQLSPNTLDRLAWLEWVRRSRRSRSNLIEQEEVDPQIERHMIIASVNRFATDVKIGRTTPTKPVDTMDTHKRRYRFSTRRTSVDKSMKQEETKRVECPNDSRRKRKESHHNNNEEEPVSKPQLVRVTTSMVLDYQEGIWQTIKLERQAHLPPPPNHQKRRFISNTSQSSIDLSEEFPSELDKELKLHAQKTEFTQCPVCSSSIRLPLVEEIFHCDSCGAFASAELMRSLAHDH